jgi:hypothetical protein
MEENFLVKSVQNHTKSSIIALRNEITKKNEIITEKGVEV